MTVVLVHGNPETEAIWNPLVDALGRDDVVRVSPPGFGAPLPDDFPATRLAYRDTLVRGCAGKSHRGRVLQRAGVVARSGSVMGLGVRHGVSG
jgi:pimeloyl-ACP methyl ester carboxylesterase